MIMLVHAMSKIEFKIQKLFFIFFVESFLLVDCQNSVHSLGYGFVGN